MMNVNRILLKPHSGMIVSGCTGSGKTRFVKKHLENSHKVYEQPLPVATLYCYGVYQSLYDEMKKSVNNIAFHEGLPTAEMLLEMSSDGVHRIIVIDDLQHRAVDDPVIELLFTQICHHRHLTCIFLQQNLYMKGRHSRTIALNAWYIVLMENVRDKLQIQTLAKQMYPHRSQILMQAYEDAIGEPWGYLLVDTSPGMKETERLRTNIFPGQAMVIYVPKL